MQKYIIGGIFMENEENEENNNNNEMVTTDANEIVVNEGENNKIKIADEVIAIIAGFVSENKR